MATFDYSKPLATANRLIARFGQRGAIRRLTPGNGPSYNPGDPTPTDYIADFAIVGFLAKEVDGTRILSSDKKALVSPGTLPIVITPTDQLVEADGTVWKIIPPVEVLRPAETTLMITLQVRK